MPPPPLHLHIRITVFLGSIFFTRTSIAFFRRDVKLNTKSNKRMRAMRRRTIALFFASLASTFSVDLAAAPKQPPAPASKPNILFILADDLGYGDVGVFYQNGRAAEGKPAFATPNLDALAAGGMLMPQHYTAAPVCAPARASLLTGQTQGDCNVRDNQFDKAINGWTLGSVLQKGGYHTAVIGKWGVAGLPDSVAPAHPLRRGFNEFFGFLRHRYGHVYYHDPKHPLEDGFQDVTAQYENIYSTDLFTARAKKFITEQETHHPAQPFFLYLAYTSVHAALQVPGGPYPTGGGEHGGLQWPLKPTPKTRNTWIFPAYAKTDWNQHMKRYATMAHRMDRGIGDIMQLLRDLKIANNTLVIFTSDNGPANEGGADPRYFSSWGPFDGFKRDCWEGGMREPTIAYWPGHIAPHSIDNVPSAFWDWMPTFADLAGLAPPAQTDGNSLLPTLLHKGVQRSRGYLYMEYNFHETHMQPASVGVFKRKGVTGRGQQQAVRIGDFLAIRTQIKHADDPLRLYDVVTDPHEDHNIAGDPAHAELLHRMTALLVTARRPNPSAPRPYDDVLLPAVHVRNLKNNQLNRSVYYGSWPWVPDFNALNPASSDTSKGVALPAQMPDRPFGLKFTGYISVPADGKYTFTASSDSGIDLWLHDAHMINSDQSTTAHPISASILLQAGLHPIRVFYRHARGSAALELKYAGPNIPEQSVPASAFQSP